MLLPGNFSEASLNRFVVGYRPFSNSTVNFVFKNFSSPGVHLHFLTVIKDIHMFIAIFCLKLNEDRLLLRILRIVFIRFIGSNSIFYQCNTAVPIVKVTQW